MHDRYKLTKNSMGTTMDFFLTMTERSGAGFNLNGYGEDKWGPVLPYYRTTVLPYYRTAVLPYCRTAVLPYYRTTVTSTAATVDPVGRHTEGAVVLDRGSPRTRLWSVAPCVCVCVWWGGVGHTIWSSAPT